MHSVLVPSCRRFGEQRTTNSEEAGGLDDKVPRPENWSSFAHLRSVALLRVGVWGHPDFLEDSARHGTVIYALAIL